MRKIFGTRNWYAQKWIIILFPRGEFYEIHLCRSFSLILIDVFHHVSNYFRICHDFHQRSRFLIPSVLIIPEKKNAVCKLWNEQRLKLLRVENEYGNGERKRKKQHYLRLNFILCVDTICDKHVYMYIYIYIFRVLNRDL